VLVTVFTLRKDCAFVVFITIIVPEFFMWLLQC